MNWWPKALRRGIKARQTGHLLEFIVDQPQRAVDLLKAQTERWRVSLFGDRLHVITETKTQRPSERTTRERLGAQGIQVLSRTKNSAFRSKTYSSAWWRRRAAGQSGVRGLNEGTLCGEFCAQTRKN